MFTRILKIIGIVLASFTGVVGVATGVMAIRGDFSNPKIKPTSIYFVDENGVKIANNEIYYVAERDYENNTYLYYNENGEEIDSLYFIVGADPEKTNVLDVDMKITSENGKDLIEFHEMSVDEATEEDVIEKKEEIVAKIGKKTYFYLKDFDDTIPDGMAIVQGRADNNQISTNPLKIYIDFAVKGITIKDNYKNDVSNANYANEFEIDEFNQLVQVKNQASGEDKHLYQTIGNGVDEKVVYDSEEIFVLETSTTEIGLATYYKPTSNIIVSFANHQAKKDNADATIIGTGFDVDVSTIDYANGIIDIFALEDLPAESLIRVSYKHTKEKIDDDASEDLAPKATPTPKARQIDVLLGSTYDLSAIFVDSYSKKPISSASANSAYTTAKSAEFFIINESDREIGDFVTGKTNQVFAKALGKFTVRVACYATYMDYSLRETEDLADKERTESEMVYSDVVFNVVNIDIDSLTMEPSSNFEIGLFEDKNVTLNSLLANEANSNFNLNLYLRDSNSNVVMQKYHQVEFVQSNEQFNTITNIFNYGSGTDMTAYETTSEYVAERSANLGTYLMFVTGNDDENITEHFDISFVGGTNAGKTWKITPNKYYAGVSLKLIVINSNSDDLVSKIGLNLSLVGGSPALISDDVTLNVSQSKEEIIGNSYTAEYCDLDANTTIPETATYKEKLYFISNPGDDVSIRNFATIKNGIADTLVGFIDDEGNVVYDKAVVAEKIDENSVVKPIDGIVNVYAVTIRADKRGNWYNETGELVKIEFVVDAMGLDNFQNAIDQDASLEGCIDGNQITLTASKLKILFDIISRSTYNDKIAMFTAIKNATAQVSINGEIETEIGNSISDISGIVTGRSIANKSIKVIFPISDLSINIWSCASVDGTTATIEDNLSAISDEATFGAGNAQTFYLREYFKTDRDNSDTLDDESVKYNTFLVIHDAGNIGALDKAVANGNYTLKAVLFNNDGTKNLTSIASSITLGALSQLNIEDTPIGGQYACKITINSKIPDNCYLRFSFEYLEYESLKSEEPGDKLVIISSAVKNFDFYDYTQYEGEDGVELPAGKSTTALDDAKNPHFVAEGSYDAGVVNWKLYPTTYENNKYIKSGEGISISDETDIFEKYFSYSPRYALNYEWTYDCSNAYADYLTIENNKFTFNRAKNDGLVEVTISNGGIRKTIYLEIKVANNIEFGKTSEKPEEFKQINGSSEPYYVIYNNEDLFNDSGKDTIFYKISEPITGNGTPDTVSTEGMCTFEIVSITNQLGANILDTGVQLDGIAGELEFIARNYDIFVCIKVSATFCAPIYLYRCLSNPIQIQKQIENIVLYQNTAVALAELIDTESATNSTDAFIKLKNNSTADIEISSFELSISVKSNDQTEFVSTMIFTDYIMNIAGNLLVFAPVKVGQYKIAIKKSGESLAMFETIIDVKPNLFSNLQELPILYSGNTAGVDIASYLDLTMLPTGSANPYYFTNSVNAEHITYDQAVKTSATADILLTITDGANCVTKNGTILTANWVDRTTEDDCFTAKFTISTDTGIVLRENAEIIVQNPYKLKSNATNIEAHKKYSFSDLLSDAFFGIGILNTNGDVGLTFDGDSPTATIDKLTFAGNANIKIVGTELVFDSYSYGIQTWTISYDYQYGINEENDSPMFVKLSTIVSVNVLPANYNKFVTVDESTGLAGTLIKKVGGDYTFAGNGKIFDTDFAIDEYKNAIGEESSMIKSAEIELLGAGDDSVSYEVKNGNEYVFIGVDGKSLVFTNALLGNGQIVTITANIKYADGAIYNFDFDVLVKMDETINVNYPIFTTSYDSSNEDAINDTAFESVKPGQIISLFGNNETLNNISRISITKASDSTIGDIKGTLVENGNLTLSFVSSTLNLTAITNGNVISLKSGNILYATINKTTGIVSIANTADGAGIITLRINIDNGVFADYVLYLTEGNFNYSDSVADPAKGTSEIDFTNIVIRDANNYNTTVIWDDIKAYLYDEQSKQYIEIVLGADHKYTYENDTIYNDINLHFAFFVFEDTIVYHAGNCNLLLTANVTVTPNQINDVTPVLNNGEYDYIIHSTSETVAEVTNIASLFDVVFSNCSNLKNYSSEIFVGGEKVDATNIVTISGTTAPTITLNQYVTQQIIVKFVLVYHLGIEEHEDNCSTDYIVVLNYVVNPDTYFVNNYNTSDTAYTVTPTTDEQTLAMSEFLATDYANDFVSSKTITNAWTIAEITSTNGWSMESNLLKINAVADIAYIHLQFTAVFANAQTMQKDVWLEVLPDIYVGDECFVKENADSQKTYEGKTNMNPMVATLKNETLQKNDQLVGSSVDLSSYIQMLHANGITPYATTTWIVSVVGRTNDYLLAFENGVAYFPHIAQDTIVQLKIEVTFADNIKFASYLPVYVELPKTYDLVANYVVEYSNANDRINNYETVESNSSIANLFEKLYPFADIAPTRTDTIYSFGIVFDNRYTIKTGSMTLGTAIYTDGVWSDFSAGSSYESFVSTLNLNDDRLTANPVSGGVGSIALNELNKGVNQFSLSTSNSSILTIDGNALTFASGIGEAYARITTISGVDLNYVFKIVAGNTQLKVTYPANVSASDANGNAYYKMTKTNLSGTGTSIVSASGTNTIGTWTIGDDSFYNSLQIYGKLGTTTISFNKEFGSNSASFKDTDNGFILSLSTSRILSIVNIYITISTPQTLVLYFVADTGYLGELRILLVPDMTYTTVYGENNYSYEALYGTAYDNALEGATVVNGIAAPNGRYAIRIGNASLGEGYAIEYSASDSSFVSINQDTKYFAVGAVGSEPKNVTIYISVKFGGFELVKYSYELLVNNHLEIDMPYATGNAIDVYLSQKTNSFVGISKYETSWSNVDIEINNDNINNLNINSIELNDINYTFEHITNGYYKVTRKSDSICLGVAKYDATQLSGRWSVSSVNSDLLTCDITTSDGVKDINPLKNNSTVYYFVNLGNFLFAVYKNKVITDDKVTYNLQPTANEYWNTAKNVMNATYNEYVFMTLKNNYMSDSISSRYVNSGMRFGIDYQRSNVTSTDVSIDGITGAMTVNIKKITTVVTIYVDVITTDFASTQYSETFALTLHPSIQVADNTIRQTNKMNKVVGGQSYYILTGTGANSTYSSLENVNVLNKNVYNPNTSVDVGFVNIYRAMPYFDPYFNSYRILYANDIKISNDNTNVEQKVYTYSEFEGYGNEAGTDITENFSYNDMGAYEYILPLVESGNTYVVALKFTASNGATSNVYFLVANNISIINTIESDGKFMIAPGIGKTNDYYYHLLSSETTSGYINNDEKTINDNNGLSIKFNTESNTSPLMFTSNVESLTSLAKNLTFNITDIAGDNVDPNARFDLVYVIKDAENNYRLINCANSKVGIACLTEGSDTITPLSDGEEVVDIYLRLMASDVSLFTNEMTFEFNFLYATSSSVFTSFAMSMSPSDRIIPYRYINLKSQLGFTNAQLGIYQNVSTIGIIQDNNITLDTSDTAILKSFIANGAEDENLRIVAITSLELTTMKRAGIDSITDQLYLVKYSKTINDAIYSLEKELYVLCSLHATYMYAPNLINSTYTVLRPTFDETAEEYEGIEFNFDDEIMVVDSNGTEISLGDVIQTVEWKIEENDVTPNLAEMEEGNALTLSTIQLAAWSADVSSPAQRILTLSLTINSIVYSFNVTVYKPIK